MYATTRNPWTEMSRLMNELDRSFFGWDRLGRGSDAVPAINVWRKDGELLITAQTPGMEPKDLKLTVHNDKLTMEGEFSPHTANEGASYYRSERSAGSFRRELTLPFRADPDRVSAKYQNGILQVSLHQTPESQPRQITITEG